MEKYIIKHIGTYYPDPDDTTSNIRLYCVHPNLKWDGQDAWDDGFLAEIEQDVGGLFPSRSCSHEHDCCGQWYPSRGRIISEEWGYVIVSQSWQMNV